MFGLGHTELLLILLVVVFIFGAKRLPEIGRALGRVQDEFKEGKRQAMGESPPAAQNGSEKDPEAAGEDEESGLERELKNQLVSRLPGVGRLNRIKKAAEVVSRVAKGSDDQKG